GARDRAEEGNVSTTTSTKPGNVRDEPAGVGPKPPNRRRRSAIEIIGAIVVAGGAVLVARAAFGITGVILDVAIGYAAFVLTIALAEFRGRKDDGFTDLREPALEPDRMPTEPPTVLVDPIVLQVVPDLDPEADQPLKYKSFTKADLAEVIIAV